jgi:hypothetical protein
MRTAISAKTTFVLYQTQGAGNLPPPPGQGWFSPPFVVLVTAVTTVIAGGFHHAKGKQERKR